MGANLHPAHRSLILAPPQRQTWCLVPLCTIMRHNMRMDNYTLGEVLRTPAFPHLVNRLEDEAGVARGTMSTQQIAG